MIPHHGTESSARTALLVGALAGIALASLGGVATHGLVGAPRPVRAVEERSLPARLAAVDAAIGREDVGRAALAWRDAYSIALGSRRWDAMLAMGDAATRIDALAGRRGGAPTGFRAEARQAYLRALFDARAARSPEGMHRAADAFAALGDAEMAARAHAMAGDRR
ncbi:MAG TPA: hypothetical protein VJU81_00280 [Methylomirabilota bacterium]|nr:hypothetical protein [Methylomirabilota bacterium]